ncbi:hypothetical protein LTR36_002665 [Oleoguttula mirabilis]|uniref:Uncharacterized protein n=1 Tax=Oleoguttula mirabilis TaxID=1507867 RepID=A0AAV9JMJ3_9PEZI|nr:hypothetical protein LTR36_002665 [Oleoguttula mirabilis]
MTMHLAPPPNPRDLLPPLLACLPTAFLSPRPPPALLPLLAPILRQRMNFVAASTPTGNDGWLPLLSWDQQRASKLPAAVERMQIEPHPVSGEVELDDVRPAKYRRLDDETLQSRLEVEQFDLLPVYVWCENDEHGGTGPGWKLTELRSLEDTEDGTEWFDTLSEADDAANSHSFGAPQSNGNGNGNSNSNGHAAYAIPADNDDDDDDDYWGAYDRTPGQTPAPKRSPAPPTNSSVQMSNRQRTQSELEYFDRYGAEVQPAMDGHDPDEEYPELGESTLTGDALVRAQARNVETDDSSLPHDSAPTTTLDRSRHSNDLSMPRAISPSSSHSSVDKLEERAAAMSSGEDNNDRAQLGIKQHISTDIKSLFRLARSAGMERKEFERVVRTELDVLGLMEQDE